MPHRWIECPNGCTNKDGVVHRILSIAKKPQCRQCYKRMRDVKE